MGDRVDAAHGLWLEGRPFDAASLLVLRVAPEVVVAWAASICEPFLGALPHDLAAHARLVLSTPQVWSTAKRIFSQVRAYGLKHPNAPVQPVEHALKLAFNVSGGQPSFDDQQFERLVLWIWKNHGPEGRKDAWALVTDSAPATLQRRRATGGLPRGG
jgi:hypothetical protein